MKRHWLQLCLIVLLIASFNFQSVQAEAGTVHTYVPIGSGYSSYTLQLFARQAVQHDTDGTVEILVIPITFATNAFNISNGERQQNLTLADNRRGLVESACNAVKLPNQTCHAVLAPVLVRDDAFLQRILICSPLNWMACTSWAAIRPLRCRWLPTLHLKRRWLMHSTLVQQ